MPAFALILAFVLPLSHANWFVGSPPRCEGNLIAFGGTRYAIEKHLGAGMDGRVVRVHDPVSGKLAIKSYGTYFAFFRDLRIYRKLARDGYEVADIVALDRRRKRIAFRYHDLVVLKNFRRVHATVNAEREKFARLHPRLNRILSFDPAAVENDYDDLLERLHAGEYANWFFHDENVGLDLDSGRLVILDPH